MLTTAGHITRILLLVLFIPASIYRDRLPALGRRFFLFLAGLAVVALAAHLDFLSSGHLHTHEFFHYYINSKYFPELGYAGLYDATTLADYEDDRSSFDPTQGVRSLITYEMEPRITSIGRAKMILSRFSPERWADFKSDIAFFRQTDGDIWKSGESLRDHGYNGSPLVTAILGGLARQPFLSTSVYIRVAAWFDIALVVLAGVILAFWFGPETGLLWLFLWAVNPFNDHAYIGGAYLRYLYLIALLASLVAYAKGRFVTSGIAFAVASLLRGFPGFLLAGLLIQNLVSRDRRALLRRHAPLFYSAAASVLILLAATSLLVRTPDGRTAWAGFAQKMSLHSDRLSPNVLGLRYLFFYSEERNVAGILKAYQEGRNLNWVVEAGKTFAANRGVYLGVMTVLVAALLILLRRGRPEDGLFAGLVLVFAWFHLAHYHYAVLALVPFIYPGRRNVLVALTAFWVAVAITCLLPRSVEIMDFRFYVVSGLTSLYFVATLVLRALDRGPGPPGSPSHEIAA